MDQQSLDLTPVPTGEASYRHDPAERNEGTYFALSYRGKRVCIDSGIQAILESFTGQPADQFTLDALDSVLVEFLKDYTAKWWRNSRTGEFLELEKITSSAIRTAPADEPFTPRQLTQMTLVLSPHYKVPNAN